MFHHFLLLQELALDIEQETSDGFGLLAMLAQFLLVDVKHPRKIAQQRLAVKHPSVFVDAVVEFLLGIILVIDVTDDFLQHILERGDTLGATEFINDNRHVHFLHAEVFKQVVQHARLGDKIGGAYQRLPLESLVSIAYVRQQVLGIEDALDVIGSFLIDRHARIACVNDLAHHLVEVFILVDIHHIDTRSHDITHRLISEREYAFKQFLVVGILDLTHLQGSCKVIY